jgi:formylglycine-generating enzyme required for sulfatase activity
MKLARLAGGLIFVWVLVGCDQKSEAISAHTIDKYPGGRKKFIEDIKSRLVYVKGGEFLMGDYGAEYGPENLRYDLEDDSKPLHKVRLSTFSISKFKITNHEYQYYLKENSLQLRRVEEFVQDWADINSAPHTPAHMDWYEAEKYCSWLAEITDLPFYLPTEAQWEYAARSGGRFLIVATDDGAYRITNTPNTESDGPRGINISTSLDREDFAKKMGWKTGYFTPLPVDKFPPNPLGLYGMSDNGFEWVKDWYDPDYYSYSPIDDPQGPDAPIFKGPASNNKYAKVFRGVSYANPQWGGGVNVQRHYGSPDGNRYSPALKGDLLMVSNKTARCVVNSAEKIM